MTRRRPAASLFAALALVLGTGALLPTAAAAEGLVVGDRAPDFELAASTGGKVRLSEVLKQRGGAVLAWFPRAFTGG